ncbi:interleukin-1 receptor-like 1 [Pelobates cultripes]|uniref:Soluble interferon alpha/beta receptor OPG204 n=1 Tax=Pelobates cultripes TaxID=61616 RepID=A0AAD1R4D1_PELCU|nr:interleukin-1 receptor-like 1 [Pelobates cultripes]
MFFSGKIFMFTCLIAFVFAIKYRKKYARENEAYILECPLNPTNTNETITWSQYNESISANIQRRVHATGKYLFFLPAVMNDTGLYTCTIQSTLKSKYSHVSLIMSESHDNCSAQPIYPQRLGMGTGVYILCPDIDLYEHKSNFIWYKECKPLHGERYMKIDTGLSLNHFTELDQGIYNCKFTYTYNGKTYTVNRFKNITMKAYIQRKPTLETAINRTIEVALGDPLNISCSAFIGYNKSVLAAIFWSINGTHVASLNYSRFQEYARNYITPSHEFYIESTLHIRKVEEQDFNSNFTCFVSSSRGGQDSIVILKYPE